MATLKELTPEALKIYDRQRFIGLDVQKRLLNSLILLTPINGIITELAKNLVLCGCNLALYDRTVISQEDVDTNFLFSPHDILQPKAKTLRSKLLEMNPMVNIEIIEDLKENPKELQLFNIIAVSTGEFKEMEKWDKISKNINCPVYILWCCGLYGFFYAGLGSDYKYVKTMKCQSTNDKENEEKKIEEYQLKAIDFRKTLEGPFNKRVKDVFLGIRMMSLAEEKGLKYDSDKESVEMEKEFLNLLRNNIELKEKQCDFLKKFAKFYGLNFIPVYSVVGSVASQEFIKVIGRDQEPGKGWFCYDSDEGYGKFEIIN